MSEIRCRIGFMTLAIMAVLTPASTGWAQHNESAGELKQGVVVESVAKNSDAENMGFARGDVILSWMRGDHHGLIEAPFDLLEVEIEELPHGAVTLEGLSGTTRKSWVWPRPISVVLEGTWGLVVRPNFTGSLLKGYEAGQASAAAGKSSAAAESWQAIAREAENRQSPQWLAGWLWLRGAESLAANKEADAADRACQKAAELVKADSSVSTKILRACGDLFLKQHDDDQAQRYYKQALANLRNLKPRSLSTASVLTHLGRIAHLNEETAEGEVLVGEALQIQQQLAPASPIVAANFFRIGGFFQATGDLDQSREFLLRALALRENFAPGTTVLAATLQSLGDTFLRRGDPDKAEQYHLRALKLYEELRPGTLDLAGCLVDVASGARDRGELAKAEEYYRRALAIQRKLSPKGGGAAASLNNLGLLMQERGQLAAAEEFFKQSLEIKQELSPGSIYVANTLGNLGDVLAQEGDTAQAEKYLRDALTILLKKDPKRMEVGDTYGDLGDLAWQRQDVSQAEDYYRKALAIYEATGPSSPEIADDLQKLGNAAWKRGDAADAETNYLRALKIRENTGRASYADTLLALAEVARSKQQWDVAANRFEQGLQALERQTPRLGGTEEVRADFRAQRLQKYRAYVDLLLVQKQTEHALDVLERSRARTLLETLAAAHVDVRKGADPELIGRERSFQAALKAKYERRISLLEDKHTDEQIKAVEKEISDLTSQYQGLEAQLRFSSPGYAALTQPQPLSAKEIQQQLLDPDTLLLEYSLGEEHSHVFAVTQESLAAFELPKGSEIEQRARQVYGLLTERRRGLPGETEVQGHRARTEAAFNQVAAELSRMILGPVAKQLQGKRLVVVADGALHFVPFAALPEPVAAPTTNRIKPAPLALKHEIVNLPSASVLAVLRQEHASRQPSSKAVAVLADPVFAPTDPRVKGNAQPGNGLATASRAQEEKNSDPVPTPSSGLLTRSAADVGLSRDGTLSLPRLPFSRREADAIMAVTPDGLGMRAVDFDANRETATSPELAQYRIVHFATHGLLDSQHPELSGLVLSLVDKQGRHKDGFLQLGDIYNMNLPADLVVLSACETGLGKEVNGEGLIGLTRGFMYAGATRVVSSLWKVDDFATAKLMKAFYTAMERDGKRPAQALREAQLSLLNDRRWSSPYYWAGFTIQGEWK